MSDNHDVSKLDDLIITLIDSVKVGDQVNFELKLEGSTGEVTAIQKQ